MAGWSVVRGDVGGLVVVVVCGLGVGGFSVCGWVVTQAMTYSNSALLGGSGVSAGLGVGRVGVAFLPVLLWRSVLGSCVVRGLRACF